MQNEFCLFYDPVYYSFPDWFPNTGLVTNVFKNTAVRDVPSNGKIMLVSSEIDSFMSHNSTSASVMIFSTDDKGYEVGQLIGSDGEILVPTRPSGAYARFVKGDKPWTFLFGITGAKKYSITWQVDVMTINGHTLDQSPIRRKPNGGNPIFYADYVRYAQQTRPDYTVTPEDWLPYGDALTSLQTSVLALQAEQKAQRALLDKVAVNLESEITELSDRIDGIITGGLNPGIYPPTGSEYWPDLK